MPENRAEIVIAARNATAEAFSAVQKALHQLEVAADDVGKKTKRSLTESLQSIEQTASSIGGKLKGVGSTLSAAITLPIIGIGAAATKMAMDVVESENLFRVAFGDMAGSAEAWSKQLSASLGLNQFELRRTSATLNQMFLSMGLGKQAAFDMSTSLTMLAADMSSFFNLKPEETFEKLRAGISGETEPLKRLGIIINETTTKAAAFKHGIAELGSELTEQQKVQARYLAIMDATKNAQGDLARTIGSPTNQLRIMRERMNEVMVTLGQALLPVMSRAIEVISGLVPYLKGAVEWFKNLSPWLQTSAIGAAALFAAIGPSLWMLGSMSQGVAAVAGALSILTTNAGTATAALGGLKTAFAVMTGPIGLATAALAGIGFGIYQLIGAFEEFKQKWSDQGFWRAVGNTITERRETFLSGPLGIHREPARQGPAPQRRLTTQELEEEWQQGIALNQKYQDSLKQTIAPLDAIAKAKDRLNKSMADFERATKDATQRAKQYWEDLWQRVGAGREAVRDAQEAIANSLSVFQRGQVSPVPTAIFGTQDLSHWAVGLPTGKAINKHLVDEARAALAPSPWAIIGKDAVSSIPRLLEDAFTGGGGFGGALKGLTSRISGQLGQALFTAGPGGLFGGAVGGFLKNLLPNALGSIIPGIGQAIGALAGPLISKIGQLFTGKPEWKKLGSDVGRDFGVSLSDGVLKAMEADSKKFGRHAASLLHLDEIFKAGGGVEAFGIDKAIGKTRDLFVMLETKALDATQVTRTLSAVFPELAQAATAASGLVSAGFLELISLHDRAGLNAAQVNQYVLGQAQSATQGLMAFVQNATVSNKLAAMGVGEAIGALFTEMQARGLSVSETLRQLGPLATAFRAQLAETGFTGGEAFDRIARLASIASDKITGPAITAVDGLGQALRGLHNAGIRNQDVFVGLSSQVASMFRELERNGVAAEDLFVFMGDELQTIWELQRRYNFTLDDTTLKLLLAAEAGGFVGEAHRSWQDQLVTGIGRIVTAVEGMARKLGVDLPQAMETGAASILQTTDEMVGGINDALSRLPSRIDIGVGIGGRGGPEIDLPGAQHGGLFSRPTFRVIAERGPEVVGSPNAIVQAFEQALVRSGAGLGGSGTVIQPHFHIEIGGHSVRDFVVTEIRQALRDGRIPIDPRVIRKTA